jgi:hypothetical protein
MDLYVETILFFFFFLNDKKLYIKAKEEHEFSTRGTLPTLVGKIHGVLGPKAKQEAHTRPKQ